jgi:hypothetical protein
LLKLAGFSADQIRLMAKIQKYTLTLQ